MTAPVVITAAVEGPIDEAALRRLCVLADAGIGDVYGRLGKSYVLSRLPGYNNSARHRHWVVLLDLNSDRPCAPEAARTWLPQPAQLMCLRIAVKETESWLLADREAIARFLRVRTGAVPDRPDELADPKREIVNLARTSRSRAIQDDIVPRPGSGQSVGPAYTSRMIEFIQHPTQGWRPDRAEPRSESLRRCLAGIRRLTQLPFPPAD
jgi:hypothetical protein